MLLRNATLRRPQLATSRSPSFDHPAETVDDVDDQTRVEWLGQSAESADGSVKSVGLRATLAIMRRSLTPAQDTNAQL